MSRASAVVAFCLTIVAVGAPGAPAAASDLMSVAAPQPACAAGKGACGTKCCPHGKTCVTPAPTPKHKHPKARCQCVAPRKHCPSGCVDTASDPKNCGGCHHKCAAGTVCSDGQCVQACAQGQTNCSGACVSETTDPFNCDGCGTVCGNGGMCSNGVCQVSCSGMLKSCGGQCVDTNTDAANCGDCGVSCAANGEGHRCIEGSCGCDSLGDCPSAGTCGATGCSNNFCIYGNGDQCSPPSCGGDLFTPAGTCGTGPDSGMCVHGQTVSCGPCHCGSGATPGCDCTCGNCQANAICDFSTGPCCWPSGVTGCSISHGNGDTGDCCSGNFCIDDTTSATTGVGNGLCCRPGGIGCSSDGQCCPGYACTSPGGNGVCCGTTGAACGGPAPCCDGLSCNVGICG